MKKIMSISMIFILIFSIFTSFSVTNNEKVSADDGDELTYLFFDFGTSSSPVAENYKKVSNTMQYNSERGYGISKNVASRDRGNPDRLRRDFIIDSNFHFYVDLPDGDYKINLTAGDDIAFNRTGITINGESKGEITSSAGEYTEYTEVITVTGGQLDIHLTENGRINGLEILPMTPPNDITVDNKTVLPNTSVTLNWSEVENTKRYNVYRKGSEDFGKIGSTESTSFIDEEGLEIGKTYTYAVTQINEDNIESAKSEEVSVEMIDESVDVSSAPSGLSIVSASDDRNELKWDPVDGALQYYVYRTKYEHRPYELVGVTEDASFIDDNVLTSLNFYYKVVAMNLGGFSEESDVLIAPSTKVTLRQMEDITRSPVAVKVENGVYLGWRMLGTDPDSVAFDVYRDGVKINDIPITESTNYIDEDGTAESIYHIRALNVSNQVETEIAQVWEEQYLSIPLDKPEGGVTPDGVAYEYSANDASVGDLTGDGNYEIILKWDPSNSKDNSLSGYTGNVYIDAYKLDGTKLWRMDLGKNIRAGAHYTQFLVYDFDGNGKSEVVFKTADGTIDGQGNVIGDPNADWRNNRGYILSGPEFLTVFDGETGEALATTDYNPPRGNVGSWGDSYGNRVDRFLAGVAYLDGERPSFVMTRGYYTRSVLVAYNWRDGELTEEWVFDSNDPGNGAYAGQGNHSLTVGDVDGDGKDEIIFGAMVIDNDGTGLYSTGWGHGDANHMTNLNPNRPGYEVYQPHESSSSPVGFGIRDAETGELLWGVRTGNDVGRAMAADIDPRYDGKELWASGGSGLFTVEGELITENNPRSINHAAWWTGDLLRELVDHTFNSSTDPHGVGKIDKWDWENEQLVNILTPEGTRSNNGTKGNPTLQADLFGDWREEIIWPSADSTELRIYTTTDVTEHRIYTLMHDPMYRLAVAWQNVAYNQPPHPSFFIGHNMEEPPTPYIFTGDVINADVQVSPNTLNLKSNGGKNSFNTRIELQSDYNISDIDIPTVKMNVNGKSVFAEISPSNNNGNSAMIKFDRQAIINAFDGITGEIEVTITGYFTNGNIFIGKDVLKIIR
ncbi:hypothetical protein QA612_10115 [Evansella sp. AB-P1]|uniref:rhamnogalacturonan lyase family protein n=1 Tax=Evansella sp. AB-P1 TaxID=3037653 RepID=UPI00241F8464|nr:hypothetical protein [Evansella sp. AB-P1]MDG5787853.1 hypothetical protein [Evansella sp. AB-P1]